jgi:hypothetical protein
MLQYSSLSLLPPPQSGKGVYQLSEWWGEAYGSPTCFFCIRVQLALELMFGLKLASSEYW